MRFSFLLLLMLLSTVSFCQTKPPSEKTLLWRISGKGLSKPSYLYGTMHLTDERLFRFSDSLLRSIEGAEGFAIELDPDDLMNALMNDIINSQIKNKLLKNAVSEKAFRKYAPVLSKKLGKPANEITVDDVEREKNKWMQDAYKKGTMSTFVDMWLFYMARQSGKWAGGIEDMEDQLSLNEGFTEQDMVYATGDYDESSKRYLEHMTQIYISQDLPAIDSQFNYSDAERRDAVLIKRNIKMARRMDSLSAIRSMVFAVGAAHLPGDSGVISMLRSRGFTVDPVFSNAYTYARNYKFTAVPVTWKKATDKKHTYEAEMPGQVRPLKLFDVLEANLSVDLFQSTAFMTMAMPDMVSASNPDSALYDLAKKVTQTESLKPGKALTLDGVKGKEYFCTSDGNYKRLQLYSNGTNIFLIMGVFKTEEDSKSETAAHFFNSLKILPAEPVVTAMQSFDDLIPGISGYAPVKFEASETMKQMIQAPGLESDAYTGIDETGAFYMLSITHTLNDKYIDNDSIYLNGIKNGIASKLVHTDQDTMIRENGLWTIYLQGQNKDGYTLFAKSLIQGNRLAQLIIVDQHKNYADKAREVLRSFKAVPFKPALWFRDTAAGAGFSTKVPSVFVYLSQTDSTDDNTYQIYNSRDPQSQLVYSVVKLRVDSTQWYNNEEEFWEQTFSKYKDGTDSLLSKSYFDADGFTGYDLVVQDKGNSGKLERIRKFLYGDTLFMLFTNVPVYLRYDADVSSFFTDFKIHYKKSATTLFTNKGPAYLQMLNSTDSATRYNARSNFYAANFHKEDIPMLRNAMLVHYNNLGDDYRDIRFRIADKLESLGDSAYDEFIISKYAEINERSGQEQTALLAAVLNHKTAANTVFVLQKLQDINSDSEIGSDVFFELDDSLALLKTNKSAVLQLLQKKNMIEDIVRVLVNMSDSNMIVQSDLQPYEAILLRYCREESAKAEASKGNGIYTLENASRLAAKLNSSASMQWLTGLLKSKYNSVKMDAVSALIASKKNVPAEVLQSLAADFKFRGSLYDILKLYHKESKFPAAFFTAQAFAQSAVYDNLVDYDYYDTDKVKITLLGTEPALLKGKNVMVYYHVISLFNGDTYISASGMPVKFNGNTEGSFTAMYDNEKFVMKQKAAFKKRVLAKLKEVAEED